MYEAGKKYFLAISPEAAIADLACDENMEGRSLCDGFISPDEDLLLTFEYQPSRKAALIQFLTLLGMAPAGMCVDINEVEEKTEEV